MKMTNHQTEQEYLNSLTDKQLAVLDKRVREGDESAKVWPERLKSISDDDFVEMITAMM